MGVGPVDRETVDIAEHPVGQDAVQVERDDDRHVRPDTLAQLLQQVAFRIEFAIGAHRAMQRDIDAVDAIELGEDRGEDFFRELLPACGREWAGAAGAGADRRHDLDIGPRLEDRERAAEFLVLAALDVETIAMVDQEVLVMRRQWVEGGNLLLAVGDQDALHRAAPRGC